VSEPEEIASHQTSLAVWDVASPVVAGRRAALKVGLSCPSGCDLTGTGIDVYDETGTRVGGGRLGPVPWPATTALHWVELDVAAPNEEGDHSWSIQAIAAGPSHEQVTAVVRFVAVRPPEHHVTLEVIQNDSGVPVAGVEVRLGRFRSATNDAGIAHVEVPGGTYEVCAWKIGYNLLSSTVHVAGDTTVHLQVAMTPEPEQPYWM
jgi:hypothetical protein